ncbi:ATP-grasp domain-containing protein [Paenarthrobacter sp. TA1.8]|uniref:ATP-grasp domain-containing protein n=1 Tax=Paenarthrobacter sp. TA1.8 TaxID=3400219 RepID=UPI003B43C0B9
MLDIKAARGDEVMLIDPSRPDSYRITLGTGTLKTILESSDGRAVCVDEGLRIWLRRPTLPDESCFGSEDLDTRRYQARVYRAAWKSLFSLPACWMNDALKSRALEVNKNLQAHIAAAVGLRTIPTLLTDDPEQFMEFVYSYQDGVALKSPVSWHRTDRESGSTMATYTRRLAVLEAMRLAPQVAHAPVIVQPYVEKLYELRVTIIDLKVFACRIDSQSSLQTSVDWRHYDLDNVRHEAISLPDEVSRALQQFMRRSGLRFAAIDMIVDRNGRHVFVEANPSGHYSWIESMTGMPISKAIASWLTSPTSTD